VQNASAGGKYTESSERTPDRGQTIMLLRLKAPFVGADFMVCVRSARRVARRFIAHAESAAATSESERPLRSLP
jgi:hypothetical protein